MAVASSFVFLQVRSFQRSTVSHRIHHSIHRIIGTCYSTTSTTYLSALSEKDETFLFQALEHAKSGLGHTYPNPAVGCVLVRQDTDEVVGSGFHPRAGFPHAEIFALLEAAGHVSDGVAAAKEVLLEGNAETTQIDQLVATYKSENGAAELFANTFEEIPVTAYVTLEPCCHHGQTPPCSASLILAKASRVVVGFRDPNPRVDGGGVQMLQDAGIEVDMAEGKINEQCAALVDSFVKRITPKDYEQDYGWLNGAMNSALRRVAGNKKREDTLAQVTWTGHVKAADEAGVDRLELDPDWLERADEHLWKEELLNLRLNKAVGKKKLARRLGERIASDLNAHVAQTVGHTVLLYRPGVPAVLDLEALVENSKSETETG
eukprot:scaffold5490_cov125-Cylindrotheca_fusiformis.AAC.21